MKWNFQFKILQHQSKFMGLVSVRQPRSVHRPKIGTLSSLECKSRGTCNFEGDVPRGKGNFGRRRNVNNCDWKMNYLRRGYLKILRQTLLCLCIYFPRQTAARNCGRFDIMRSIAQILPPGISVVVSCILVKFALLIQLVNFYMHRPSSCRSEYFYSPSQQSKYNLKRLAAADDTETEKIK